MREQIIQLAWRYFVNSSRLVHRSSPFLKLVHVTCSLFYGVFGLVFVNKCFNVSVVKFVIVLVSRLVCAVVIFSFTWRFCTIFDQFFKKVATVEYKFVVRNSSRRPFPLWHCIVAESRQQSNRFFTVQYGVCNTVAYGPAFVTLYGKTTSQSFPLVRGEIFGTRVWEARSAELWRVMSVYLPLGVGAW